jgi:hypothetical protein
MKLLRRIDKCPYTDVFIVGEVYILVPKYDQAMLLRADTSWWGSLKTIYHEISLGHWEVVHEG